MNKIFLALLIPLCICNPFRLFTKRDTYKQTLPPNAVIEYFSNKVDHFNLAATETYKQRYWYIDEHWDKTDGPAVLYINGEAPGGIVGSRSVPLELTKELKGILFALEHRFYGISQPCKDWSLNSLRLLTHDQAMADIANFIVQKTKEMGNPKRKWLLVGGSYSGALVIWFKSKYPHLADVIYSSSGVVNVIVDYKKYMQQVEEDLKRDSNCYEAITKLNEFVFRLIRLATPNEKLRFKMLLNASKLGDLDFLNYFSSIYVGEIQYSSRKQACEAIKGLRETNMQEKAIAYAKLGLNWGSSPDYFSLEVERDTRIHPTNNMRQWTYQVCTAYGWFATGTKGSLIFPEELNTEYYRGICKRVFDLNLYPDQEYTNGMLGDLRIPPQLNQVIMVNGGDDPWKWAGYLKENDTTDTRIVKVIDCEDCAHCIDLYNSTSSDPVQLKETRSLIKRKILAWMAHNTIEKDS